MSPKKTSTGTAVEMMAVDLKKGRSQGRGVASWTLPVDLTIVESVRWEDIVSNTMSDMWKTDQCKPWTNTEEKENPDGET